MAGKKQAWETREASLEDRASIEELCRASVGPDDYVLDVLDYLLTRATTHLALKDGNVIGMLSYHRQADGSGWISSARTHPDYRRLGVTRSLVNSFVKLGRSSGVTALRLWTGSVNKNGYMAFTRSGFKEVGRFTRMMAPATGGSASPKPELVTDFSEALWRKIEGSNMMRISHYYIAHGFGFLKISRPVVKHFCDESTLYVWGGQAAVLAEEMLEGRDMLDAQPLFGDQRAMLRELPLLAKTNGHQYAHTFLPHDPTILKLATENGFVTGEWGIEAILCERAI